MRRPGGDEQVTRAAGAPVLKIGGNRLADVDGDRHAFVVPALAADQDLSRPPVDVLEPDRNYFLGAKAKPCHQQQQRVVAAARTIVAVDRGDHPPRFGLDRLEVVKSALADQALGFGADLRGERRFKPPFFSGAPDPPASNCASHKRVLTSTNSRVRR